jgi:hypothetical protein
MAKTQQMTTLRLTRIEEGFSTGRKSWWCAGETVTTTPGNRAGGSPIKRGLRPRRAANDDT